jgi:hypothetical protein
MTNEEQVEEILIEAAAHGLRIEVMEYAKKYMDEGHRPVDAYQMAYHEWIK